MINYVELNNFRVDLTDILATTKSLLVLYITHTWQKAFQDRTAAASSQVNSNLVMFPLYDNKVGRHIKKYTKQRRLHCGQRCRFSRNIA